MKDVISSVEELKEATKDSVGYFITATLFDGTLLKHYTLTSHFPALDMLRSLNEIEEMVIADLKKPRPKPMKNDGVIDVTENT